MQSAHSCRSVHGYTTPPGSARYFNVPGWEEMKKTPTQRQRRVVGLLPWGLSRKEIAVRLDITPDGVTKHVMKAKKRLGLRTTAELLYYAGERGLRADGPW